MGMGMVDIPAIIIGSYLTMRPGARAASSLHKPL